jgi:hypothetical protein
VNNAEHSGPWQRDYRRHHSRHFVGAFSAVTRLISGIQQAQLSACPFNPERAADLKVTVVSMPRVQKMFGSSLGGLIEASQWAKLKIMVQEHGFKMR